MTMPDSSPLSGSPERDTTEVLCGILEESEREARRGRARKMEYVEYEQRAEALKWILGELSQLRERVETLTSAIRWALGEEGEFAGLPEGRFPGDGRSPRVGCYWWRIELRERAALSPSEATQEKPQ